MANRPILIVGANGDTASAAINSLLLRDLDTRALVRTEDERARTLRSRGINVVLGDLRNMDDVRAAVQGAGAAYFTYPIQE